MRWHSCACPASACIRRCRWEQYSIARHAVHSMGAANSFPQTWHSQVWSPGGLQGPVVSSLVAFIASRAPRRTQPHPRQPRILRGSILEAGATQLAAVNGEAGGDSPWQKLHQIPRCGRTSQPSSMWKMDRTQEAGSRDPVDHLVGSPAVARSKCIASRAAQSQKLPANSRRYGHLRCRFVFGVGPMLRNEMQRWSHSCPRITCP